VEHAARLQEKDTKKCVCSCLFRKCCNFGSQLAFTFSAAVQNMRECLWKPVALANAMRKVHATMHGCSQLHSIVHANGHMHSNVHACGRVHASVYACDHVHASVHAYGHARAYRHMQHNATLVSAPGGGRPHFVTFVRQNVSCTMLFRASLVSEGEELWRHALSTLLTQGIGPHLHPQGCHLTA